MAAPRPRSNRSTSLRDSDASEKLEGTASWDALEWTKVEVTRSVSHTNLDLLLEDERVVVEGFGVVLVNTDEIKYLVAAAIASKGLGALLFIFSSSFGAYLLLLHQAIATPILYDFYNYDADKKEFGQNFNKFTQSLAFLGALLFFIGMKNSMPRRQLKRKVPKTKTG